MRGSDPRHQRYVAQFGLMEHIVEQILKPGFQLSSEYQVRAGHSLRVSVASRRSFDSRELLMRLRRSLSAAQILITHCEVASSEERVTTVVVCFGTCLVTRNVK